MTLAGGQILGDEYSDHVVRVTGLSLFPFVHEALTCMHRTAVVSFSEKGMYSLLRMTWRLSHIQDPP